MITRVEYDNIRGLSSAVDLSARNLIVGPNGSGKTTVMVAIDFALLGLVPGYQKGDMVANASGATLRAKVTIDGHTVERTLRQGKTLQERIAIGGGTPADAKAAAPLLEAILGREPRLLNMPAFWAATASDQRRMILKLRASPEVQSKLAQDEGEARLAKNIATKSRQDCEAVVKRLTLSLAGIEKPTGNLASLEAEAKGIETDLSALLDRIRTGEANDKARASMTSRANDLPALRDAVVAANEAAKMACNDLALRDRALEDFAATKPEAVATVALPEVMVRQIKETILTLTALEADMPTWAETVAVALREIMDTMEGWLFDSDPGEAQAHKEAMQRWQTSMAELTASQSEAQAAIRSAQNAEQRAINAMAGAEDAEKNLASVGPGVDPHDVAARAGLETRLAEINAKLAPLRRLDAIEREINSAQIVAEKAAKQEDDQKAVLAGAIERQQQVVQGAAEDLARRSMAVLPDGNLVLDDDGRHVDVYWERSKVRVARCALSGGEQALFDCAVGHSLAPGALVAVEAAEVDNDRMGAMLAHFPTGFQVAVLTCHPPVLRGMCGMSLLVYEVPQDWTVITMEAK